jgi:hypothetical protein
MSWRIEITVQRMATSLRPCPPKHGYTRRLPSRSPSGLRRAQQARLNAPAIDTVRANPHRRFAPALYTRCFCSQPLRRKDPHETTDTALHCPDRPGRIPGAQAQSDTLKKVADNKKITVAYRESSVPFSYLAGTAPVGFSVDISQRRGRRGEEAAQDARPQGRAAERHLAEPHPAAAKRHDRPGVRLHHQQQHARQGCGVRHQPLLHRHAPAGEEESGIKNYADLAKKTVASTTGTTNAQVIRKYNEDKNLGMEHRAPQGPRRRPAGGGRPGVRWLSRWTTSCCSA